MANSPNPDPLAAELADLLAEVRERVRRRHPGQAAGLRLPDLMPVVEARDAAYGKVAAIGTVNPRAGGPLNAAIQGVKGIIARALAWHVRDQVDFNRAAIQSIEALLRAFDENNRALAEIAHRLAAAENTAEAAGAKVDDVAVVVRAAQSEFESKVIGNETQYLRAVADLRASFHQQSLQSEAAFRDIVRAQHQDFNAALERTGIDIQKKLWDDLARIRTEYERVIHGELRVVRQRAAAMAPAATPPGAAPGAPPPIEIDWLKFAEKFRGPEEYVRSSFALYTGYFAGASRVADLGCGRGEFLELLRDAGVPAIGVEASPELVALCRGKGLEAAQADLFEWLRSQEPESLGGIFCAQVVEHLPPSLVIELVRLASQKLARGAALVIETPNPECLAIFASHFYIDPTHVRPVPPVLLAFYCEEEGFGSIEILRREKAEVSMPALLQLPEEVRSQFFGSLDYAIAARKL